MRANRAGRFEDVGVRGDNPQDVLGMIVVGIHKMGVGGGKAGAGKMVWGVKIGGKMRCCTRRAVANNTYSKGYSHSPFSSFSIESRFEGHERARVDRDRQNYR